MIYEFKVSQLADEFGVHRNTIRNWINSGTIAAKEGPGRKYIMKLQDYQRLCEKYGREPTIKPPQSASPQAVGSLEETDREPLQLSGQRQSTSLDPTISAPCLGCGSCAGLCPISGVDGLDPRKIVRLAVLGMEEELIASDWPWKCTLCGKCEESCPAEIPIATLMRRLRGARPRQLVPGPIQRGVTTCMERGNNLGIPKQDFIGICEDIGEELREEGCAGFHTPIDVHGARLLVLVNSKLPFGEPENLKWWWKIFHAAGESWTIPSENWDGVNWGLFSGDDEAMQTIVGRLVDNMRRLNCNVLLLPECGHAYFATRYSLERWFPEALKEFKIITTFELLLEYISQGRLQLNPELFSQPVTYHDPCNYGRKSLQAFGQAYFEEPREILKAICKDFRELNPNRKSAYCCGAGGGSWAMHFNDERVFYGRIKARQIKESGARLVVVPCHNCHDQLLKSLNKEYDLDIDVKYLWEVVAEALVLSSPKAKGWFSRR